MDIEIKDHEIHIWTQKQIAEKLGAKFMSGNKYKLPKTIEAVKDLMVFTNEHPNLDILLTKMEASKKMIVELKRRPPNMEMFGLRPYQIQDVRFLSMIPHAAIFNEQRTGKTPTLLSVLRRRGLQKNLIVVPAGLKLNWEKECVKWLPGIKTFVIRGPKKQRERAYQNISELESFVMIISYDTLKAKDEMNKILATIGDQFDSMTIDEAHNMRNRKSARTIALQEMGKHALHRYALTGTPSVRDGHDVFSILQFLYPQKFTSYWAFVERYFEMVKNFFSGGKAPGKLLRGEELQNMLAMLGTNRKRKEVMEWLPDKTYTTIPIELGPRQRKAYNMVRETFEIESLSGKLLVDAPSVLAQMTRLRQICLAPSMLDINVPSAKEDFLIEWLQDNKEPVIIFSQFTSYLKELAAKLKQSPTYEKVVMIHGELSAAEKQESVDAFQSGKARILLGNIKAAGVGFTLDKATTTIFLDKEFNPVDNAQAEDRMVPVSKERIHKMDVISLVAEDTYDERINELLESKINITSIVNNGGIEGIDRLYKELKENEMSLLR